jgi:thiamine-phosphate pyrophosphorylase
MSSRTRLYLITPPTLAPQAFADPLRQALEGGDVACLQLRLEGADEAAWREATDTLMPLCHAADVSFIINDHPQLAAELGADGVHLGPEDMAIREAREIVGFKRVIGFSARDSKDAAFAAGNAGVDYVAFGAFFPSPTKDTGRRADLALMEDWAAISELPAIAIGGLSPENCGPVVRAGADFIAASSAVWSHAEGPGAAVRAFNSLFRKAHSEDS